MGRIIKTEVTLNTRDLGGLKTKDGKTTLKDVFIRSDNLPVNPDSYYALFYLIKKHHLKTVIDLRSQKEVIYAPSIAQNYKDIDYHNVSLVNYMELSGIPTGHHYHNLADWYIEIIEKSKEEIKMILEIIANAKKGALLFNCTMGKDRTSVLAFLLLSIANVDKKTIARDHQISSKNVIDAYAPYIHTLKEDQFMFTTVKYQDIISLANYIENKYQSIDAYLASANVTKATIQKIRRRFL